MRSKGRLVEARLFDMHLAPLHIQFVGDEHGEHRADALSNLRVLGLDGDDAGGVNPDEGAGREAGRARIGLAAAHGAGQRLVIEAERQAAGRQSADLQKISPIQSHGRSLRSKLVAKRRGHLAGGRWMALRMRGISAAAA